MNPTRLKEVRDTLARLGLTPRRALGQNFLIDGNIQRIVIEAADIGPLDGVLEIGPGLGALTAPLCERARRVVAIEKDPKLFAHLRERLGDRPGLELVCADALACDLGALLHSGLNKVVSNLPYSAGTRILLELCRVPARPDRMIVTLQLEVAERLAAEPASREYGLASVLAQLDYRVWILRRVPSTCFYPRPQVDSAIVVFERRTRSMELHDETLFFELLKRCFEHRRKQLGRLLGGSPALERCGIDPRRRPETLAPEEWIALANGWAESRPPSAGTAGADRR